MTEKRYCVNCRHVYKTPVTAPNDCGSIVDWDYWCRSLTGPDTTSLVTGEIVRGDLVSCTDARETDCGPDAKMFEASEGKHCVDVIEI